MGLNPSAVGAAVVQPIELPDMGLNPSAVVQPIEPPVDGPSSLPDALQVSSDDTVLSLLIRELREDGQDELADLVEAHDCRALSQVRDLLHFDDPTSDEMFEPTFALIKEAMGIAINSDEDCARIINLVLPAIAAEHHECLREMLAIEQAEPDLFDVWVAALECATWLDDYPNEKELLNDCVTHITDQISGTMPGLEEAAVDESSA